MTTTKLAPLTAGELVFLVQNLIAKGDITLDTPVAISTDPEGNQARQVGSFAIEELAATKWGVVWGYEAPDAAAKTTHLVIWPLN